MKRPKLLIATTNQGKFKEILTFLGDLPFNFVSLNDLKQKIKAPEENGATIFDNAVLKARYYSEKTGLITLSDDGGLFIETLNGWPGVISARIGNDSKSRRSAILKKMKGKVNRRAWFKIALALCDPNTKSIHTVSAETEGKILEKAVSAESGFGYDPIFWVKEKNKTYAEMTTVEKNSISHRGKGLVAIKYHLQNVYGAKHIVVPVAIIVKDSKILITKRNDPHRPEYHERWEFPGGSMEIGETIEANLIREAGEEAGYKIKPLEQLRPIYLKTQTYPTWSYQVYLIPYICSISGGAGLYNDAEILEARFIKPEEMAKMKFVGENETMFKKFLPELKQLIKKYML